MKTPESCVFLPSATLSYFLPFLLWSISFVFLSFLILYFHCACMHMWLSASKNAFIGLPPCSETGSWQRRHQQNVLFYLFSVHKDTEQCSFSQSSWGRETCARAHVSVCVCSVKVKCTLCSLFGNTQTIAGFCVFNIIMPFWPIY